MELEQSERGRREQERRSGKKGGVGRAGHCRNCGRWEASGISCELEGHELISIKGSHRLCVEGAGAVTMIPVRINGSSDQGRCPEGGGFWAGPMGFPDGVDVGHEKKGGGDLTCTFGPERRKDAIAIAQNGQLVLEQRSFCLLVIIAPPHPPPERTFSDISAPVIACAILTPEFKF